MTEKIAGKWVKLFITSGAGFIGLPVVRSEIFRAYSVALLRKYPDGIHA